jgi:hypothetical protein
LKGRSKNNGLPRGSSGRVANWLVMSIVRNDVASGRQDVGRHDWDEVGYTETAIYKVAQWELHSIANTKLIVSPL